MDSTILLTLALSLLIAAQQPNVPVSIKSQAVEIANAAISAATTGMATSSSPTTTPSASEEDVADSAAESAPLTEAICLIQVAELPVNSGNDSGPTFERHETKVYVDEGFASYFLDQGGYERC